MDFDFSYPGMSAPSMLDDFAGMGATSGGFSGSAPSSGGFWNSFSDAAKNVWGAAPATNRLSGETAPGSGVQGFLSGFGDVAKAALPFASIGTGIASFLNQRKMMDQMDRQGRQAEQAQDFAMENATLARPLANDARDIATDIRGVADRVGPLADRSVGVGDELRSLAGDVRSRIMDPSIAYATERLARAQRGEVPQAVQAQIDLWRQGALQKARDYFARSGQGDSTSMVSMENYIDQQAKAAIAQYLMQEESSAITAMEGGRGGATTAGQLLDAEGRAYQGGAQILGSEANDLGVAGNVLGVGGNILTGGGRVAGGVSQQMQAEQQSLAQLIAATEQALARMGAQK